MLLASFSPFYGLGLTSTRMLEASTQPHTSDRSHPQGRRFSASHDSGLGRMLSGSFPTWLVALAGAVSVIRCGLACVDVLVLLGVPSRFRRDWKAAGFAALGCCDVGMTLGHPHVAFALFCWLYAWRLSAHVCQSVWRWVRVLGFGAHFIWTHLIWISSPWLRENTADV